MRVQFEVTDLHICHHNLVTAAGELIPHEAAFVSFKLIPRFKSMIL